MADLGSVSRGLSLRMTRFVKACLLLVVRYVIGAERDRKGESNELKAELFIQTTVAYSCPLCCAMLAIVCLPIRRKRVLCTILFKMAFTI